LSAKLFNRGLKHNARQYGRNGYVSGIQEFLGLAKFIGTQVRVNNRSHVEQVTAFKIFFGRVEDRAPLIERRVWGSSRRFIEVFVMGVFSSEHVNQ
jgi:hypothetical protein